jgi:hypothetical protein
MLSLNAIKVLLLTALCFNPRNVSAQAVDKELERAQLSSWEELPSGTSTVVGQASAGISRSSLHR